MLEILGFLVWILMTVGLTTVPFFIFAMSALGGRTSRTEDVVCVVFIVLAGYSWYNIFSSITININ
jgi:hypothetical protein